MARHQDNARERILDGFENLLIERGDGQVSLEAVAQHVGLTKGGLLYHFGSREALIEGLLGRLETLANADLELMNTAPEGRVEYYVRTCAQADEPLDRTLIAATRLLQRSHSQAREVLNAVHDRWFRSLLEAVGDPAIARLIMLVGYGMYYNATLAGGDHADLPAESPENVEEMLVLINELIRARTGQ